MTGRSLRNLDLDDLKAILIALHERDVEVKW